MSKTASNPLESALEMGTKLLAHKEAQRQADEARAALDRYAQYGEAWRTFVEAVTESFPAELGAAVTHDPNRGMRRVTMEGDVFLAPALVSMLDCVPILAYMGKAGIRYHVRRPWIAWEASAEAWTVRFATKMDEAHESAYESCSLAEGWTDNPYIAVKMAHDGNRLAPGLFAEAERRNSMSERPPKETEAQMYLRKAERYAPYANDRALTHAVIALVHAVIDRN